MVTYDETKRRANITKHGVDMAALSGFFDGDLLTREDQREAYGEMRFQSIGWHAGEMLFVVWTPRAWMAMNGRILFRRERQTNMKAKRGRVSANDAPATKPEDWNDAFVTRSANELRAAVAARRTRGPNKRPTKEQVAVRYSPEVLAYFRATGAGWQSRMDQALREYIERRHAA